MITEQDEGFFRSNYEFADKVGRDPAIPKGRPKEIANIKQFERKNALDINKDGLFAGKDPITGVPLTPTPDPLPGPPPVSEPLPGPSLLPGPTPAPGRGGGPRRHMPPPFRDIERRW